ncbi:MAG TPA: MerR family transcriptional regulator [Pseudonocardiaceae bacterium]|nr:MerR family transcriptional regulator [Pseudonocardiaceae bacterium]
MLTIGQLATATGVSTSTIRFWERRGLLPPAARERGQRRYSEDDLSAIGMVLVCQEAGFTLAEIGQMQRESVGRPQVWREFVQTKMTHIEDSLTRLDHARKLLTHAMDCPQEDIGRCRLFQAAVGRRVGNPTVTDPPTPTAACRC